MLNLEDAQWTVYVARREQLWGRWCLLNAAARVASKAEYHHRRTVADRAHAAYCRHIVSITTWALPATTAPAFRPRAIGFDSEA